ncbi:MAG: histidinol-phosphate transaminase [Spirochaetia bacterium]|nr:histidinol-phosphate transaminase [Spirochaetia bacterium]
MEKKYTDFRNNIYQKISGYVPGEQPESNDWIKINTNENPYPPSPSVVRVLQELAKNPSLLRKYPNPNGEPLRSSLANMYNLKPENFIVTNGSDEALSLIVRIFLDQTRTAAAPEITYSLYQTLVMSVGAKYIHAPMKNYTILNVSPEALEESGADVVFLSNPNAQTGEFIPLNILEKLISKSKKLWVIDEAYNDFVDIKPSSFLHILKEHENVIVVRTFSKSHSMAGMRIGYAASVNPVIMQGFLTGKDSYNEDVVSILTGKASLEDGEYLHKVIQSVQLERTRMMTEFLDRNFLVLPSEANFLLIQPPESKKAHDILLKLKEQKILVRHFNSPLLAKYLRISIGTKEENNELLKAIDFIVSS